MAIYAPIWKDTYYTTTEDRLEYTLVMDGGIIFKGKAYKMPEADELKVKINGICQNYLSCQIQALLEDETVLDMDNPNACKTFYLTDSEGVVLESYTFLYDWSYEDWDGSSKVLSHPINGHYTSEMYKPLTKVYSGIVNTHKLNGSYDFETCGDYALYYLNCYGGWDAFLIEGNVIKSDTITQYKTTQSYNNTTLDYETSRYLTTTITNWELHTGWLTDEQAANFVKNLLGSNSVYMHNFKTDTIVPVIITDNNGVYKTYKNQGKKMVNYTIKVQESQSKLRK